MKGTSLRRNFESVETMGRITNSLLSGSFLTVTVNTLCRGFTHPETERTMDTIGFFGASSR